MKHEPSVGPQRIGAFAEAVRQVREPLSGRQRSAGWRRLQQTLASRARVDEHPVGWWWPPRGLRLGLALLAILGPLGWLIAKRTSTQPLQYVVSGELGGIGSRGVPGAVLAAPAGRVQLSFTDGSRIGLRSGARLTVAALRPRGSDVRLHEGTIDVDVRHRPGAEWTFEAGPYAVEVKGTSFSLGWDGARKRLDLRMRTGAVAVVGPMGEPPLSVAGGESVILDGAGSSLDRVAAVDASPGMLAVTAAPQAITDTSPAPHVARNRESQRDRRLARRTLGHAEWAPMLARGDFDEIVEQANDAGVRVCLGSDTEQNLAALADAARYTHRGDLARRSLVALRARFPGSERARDAAFFLARMSETSSADPRQALSWYERYLREAPSGSYAEEALGRAMILLRRKGGGLAARSAAGRYLKAYPHGVYAIDAAGLLEDHAVP